MIKLGSSARQQELQSPRFLNRGDFAFRSFSVTTTVLKGASDVVETGKVDAYKTRAEALSLDYSLGDVTTNRLSADLLSISCVLDGAPVGGRGNAGHSGSLEKGKPSYERSIGDQFRARCRCGHRSVQGHCAPG